MVARRARIYDALALLTVILVVALDQWTKAVVVSHLTLNGTPTPLIGNYLSLYYIKNSGAAFGLFSNSALLILFIVAAIVIISYLYLRFLNTGTLGIKLVFGMIIGGALGNLIDRARHSGYVVDFIFFQIPQIGFRFAIFNLADASISVGVFLLFVMILFGGLRRKEETTGTTATLEKSPNDAVEEQIRPSASNSTSATHRPTEQDA